MESVTVRRWVALSADAVWRRLCDVESLAADDAALELLEPPFEPETLRAGDHFVLRHQRGRRVTQLRVEIVDAEPPRQLVASLKTRSTVWTLQLEILPLAEGHTDLALRARLEETGNPSGRTGAPAVPRRVSEGIEALLDGLAHHIERAALVTV